MNAPHKPLGGRAYGSIPHLPESRMGPGDHHVHEGQARICTERVRDKHDRIIVQEKIDGSCAAIAKVDGTIIALGRAGHPASTSPYEQHHLFAEWVRHHAHRFYDALAEGQRIVGEWLAQAHSTRYALGHDPFVMFDVMHGKRRAPLDVAKEVAADTGLPTPHVLSDGPPLSVPDALSALGEYGHHGALDPVEGAVWRVERKGEVDFLAKYVRPDKADGVYLPEVSGGEAVWNWRAGALTS